MINKRIFVLIFSVAFLFAPPLALAVNYKNIDVNKAKANIENQEYGLILDVRTSREYTGDFGHIEGSRLIPIQKLQENLGDISSLKKQKVLVYCAVGGRSSSASALLAENGFSDVENMMGGMTEWNRKGYPVKR